MPDGYNCSSATSRLQAATGFRNIHYSGVKTLSKLLLPLLPYPEDTGCALVVDWDVVFVGDILQLMAPMLCSGKQACLNCQKDPVRVKVSEPPSGCCSGDCTGGCVARGWPCFFT